jgi:TrmH family RNA methyltransferase
MPGPPEIVRSRSNALVQRLRDLKRRADPEGGLMLIEGPKLLDEALRSGIEVVEAALAERVASSPALGPLRAALTQRGVAPRVLDDDLAASLSEVETSQGVLALARRPPHDPERLFASPSPLLLVLVGVQNPGNLGALLRTGEAAGAHGALLAEGCADPFAWKALRGSMGSAWRLPLLVEGLAAALARLRGHGVRAAATVAAHAPAAVSCFEADLRGPLALLFGNEGAGLPPEALEAADLRLTIPTHGAAESLNVGVAAGVLLFEAARQRAAGRAPQR